MGAYPSHFISYQHSRDNPGTRLNSSMLFVTRTALFASAVAAMKRFVAADLLPAPLKKRANPAVFARAIGVEWQHVEGEREFVDEPARLLRSRAFLHADEQLASTMLEFEQARVAVRIRS